MFSEMNSNPLTAGHLSRTEQLTRTRLLTAVGLIDKVQCNVSADTIRCAPGLENDLQTPKIVDKEMKKMTCSKVAMVSFHSRT